ncbi:MAG: methenyltetrahydromethanopterin cyclohydrolase [Candidatus Bathyarchaeia archaeon]
MLSVNRSALRLVKKLCEDAEEYGVKVKNTESGATLIDAGIKDNGVILAGKIVTEICLGGLGKAEILWVPYGDLVLPSIFVYTDHPTVATLGSQLAGWSIKVETYFAMGSGPARALALKPKELYEKIGYRDEAEEAVLALETSKEPPEEVITHIANQCGVKTDNLFLILAPTTSITGSTQISGRIVEQGTYRLMELGLDPRLITHGWGYAPIASVHPKFTEAMGRTNDALLYAGVAGYTVNYDDEEALKGIVNKAPSSSSKSYGRPFAEIFKEANYDFYQIDPGLFAPALLIVNNAKTGNSFKAGKINVEVLMKSLGI